MIIMIYESPICVLHNMTSQIMNSPEASEPPVVESTTSGGIELPMIPG